jgi:hypothetical protein
MLRRLFSRIAANLLLKLAVYILAPIPVIGMVAQAVAFVC